FDHLCVQSALGKAYSYSRLGSSEQKGHAVEVDLSVTVKPRELIEQVCKIACTKHQALSFRGQIGSLLPWAPLSTHS
ncbi:hypothetical protein ABTA61_19515, partial [Acinetobacter baumannii]